MSQERVGARSVGIIGKPHGIRGEVNVMLLTDYPETISGGSRLFLDRDCSREIQVEKTYLKKNRGRMWAVIKFLGIENRDDALGLRGRHLFRREQDSPGLAEDEFWIQDLEGCRVVLAGNREIGIVEKVEVLPANENLIVRLSCPEDYPGSKGIVQIPLIQDYVDKIDIPEKKIVLGRRPEYI